MERDEYNATNYCPNCDFNSHAHVERDCIFFLPLDSVENFNSHAHVERDRTELEEEFQQEDFNSHAHVERDDIDPKTYTPENYFNSHAHVERDEQYRYIREHKDISTHTLTWSMTKTQKSDR